jgi:lariat debranching enzyme
MSCPVKYHAIGDFHAYYSGKVTAPYLTIFVGGNHEASSHMWELYYGGWAAPNIYYMGAANVVRVNSVRIAGMSGIWKGYNYNKPHYERLPYNQDDIKSIYHIRELDVRKLLQIQTQVDIGISHDWPKGVEKKPDFKQESLDGTLGSTAAKYVMDRLRPPYWFAAHMHIKFAATTMYGAGSKPDDGGASITNHSTNGNSDSSKSKPKSAVHNEDEIALDTDDDDDVTPASVNGQSKPNNPDEIVLDDDDESNKSAAHSSAVPEDVRAQLPAAFAKPKPAVRQTPGQPVPSSIKNKTVRFLALDKCLPGRKYLQLLEIPKESTSSAAKDELRTASGPRFEYDPEWLAITRVFAADLVLGNKHAQNAPDLGEEHYKTLIEKEMEWVQNNIVEKDKLEIPRNFELTAHIYEEGTPEIVSEGPVEYNNPQTQHFCDLVGIENKFFATDQEKLERMQRGPAASNPRFDNRGRGGGRGHGRGRGRGGGGRGRGRGYR